jgi:hypothetical protein
MKKKSIYKLILEFVLIFSAVTLSFLAEDYREYSKLRELEKGTLEGILKDLNFDQNQLKSIIYFDSLKLDTSEDLQQILNAKKPEVEKVEHVVSQFFGGTTFNLTSSHYESLSSSGMLKEITNEELRSKLIYYYDSFGKHLVGVTELYQSEFLNYLHSIDQIGIMQGRNFNVRATESLASEIEWKAKMSRVYTFTSLFDPQFRVMLDLNKELQLLITQELE